MTSRSRAVWVNEVVEAKDTKTLARARAMKTTPVARSPTYAMELMIIKKIPAPAMANPTPANAMLRFFFSRSASFVGTGDSSSDGHEATVA